LTVVGPMIQKAIEMAKLNQEIIALEAAWASAAVAKQSAASRAFMDAPNPLRPPASLQEPPPAPSCRRGIKAFQRLAATGFSSEHYPCCDQFSTLPIFIALGIVGETKAP